MGITGLSDRALVEALRGTLAEMARVIPVRSVLKIAEHFGGTRLSFSHTPKADGKLARLVGISAARALGRHYCGEQVEISRANSVRREILNREICRLRKKGVPSERVALQCRVSRQHVNRVFKRKEKNS